MFRRPLVAAAALAAALAVAWPAAGSQLGAGRAQAVPQRIVSLSPTVTEDLYAVGAGKQVVAVDDQSDYPAQAPRTALTGLGPNVEAIVGYRPDLVLASYGGAWVGQLQKLGIPVRLEPAVDDLAHEYEQIREIGRVTGHAAQATRLVRSMEVELTRAIRSVPTSHRHLTVYHELDQTYYSATSATFIGRLYRLFGFRNIADGADTAHTGYPQLSGEYILEQDPQLIVLADSRCCGQSAKTVAARPGWQSIAAVRDHRVVAVDDDVASRWGPRIVQFARAIAAAARRS